MSILLIIYRLLTKGCQNEKELQPEALKLTIGR